MSDQRLVDPPHRGVHCGFGGPMLPMLPYQISTTYIHLLPSITYSRQ